MTTIYLMRHSEYFKPKSVNNNDPYQIQNEKLPLTINGEKLAMEKSHNPELNYFNFVVSSNYVRAISTAKYFTNDVIYIDESFGERKFGVDKKEELEEGFGRKQFDDFDYKYKNGESLNDVIKREEKALNDILKKCKDKKVLIVGHSTSFAALLSKWCKVSYEDPYYYNDKEIFDGKWNYCETFKLEFDGDNLINITNIR